MQCTIGIAELEKRLVIEQVQKRKRVIESIHSSSHFGVNRTLDLVSSRYYWPGLTNDVKQYVSAFSIYRASAMHYNIIYIEN